jgi:hypothetical protein
VSRRECVEVWSGVWTASPATPENMRHSPRWDRAELLEEIDGRAYVSGPGGTLWVGSRCWRWASDSSPSDSAPQKGR